MKTPDNQIGQAINSRIPLLSHERSSFCRCIWPDREDQGALDPISAVSRMHATLAPRNAPAEVRGDDCRRVDVVTGKEGDRRMVMAGVIKGHHLSPKCTTISSEAAVQVIEIGQFHYETVCR